MVNISKQFVLWHPERQVVMPFTNSNEPDGVWLVLPESASWEPEQVKAQYESQGWRVVQALVSVQVED